MEYSFLAPPLAGDDVFIVAFGDLGQAPVDDMTEQVTNLEMLLFLKLILGHDDFIS